MPFGCDNERDDEITIRIKGNKWTEGWDAVSSLFLRNKMLIILQRVRTRRHFMQHWRMILINFRGGQKKNI